MLPRRAVVQAAPVSEVLHRYLLCAGGCWGARREGALVPARLVRQGVLDVRVLVTFPLAFLKGKGGVHEEM